MVPQLCTARLPQAERAEAAGIVRVAGRAGSGAQPGLQPEALQAQRGARLPHRGLLARRLRPPVRIPLLLPRSVVLQRASLTPALECAHVIVGSRVECLAMARPVQIDPRAPAGTFGTRTAWRSCSPTWTTPSNMGRTASLTSRKTLGRQTLTDPSPRGAAKLLRATACGCLGVNLKIEKWPILCCGSEGFIQIRIKVFCHFGWPALPTPENP